MNKYGDYKYFNFLEEKDLDKLKDISIKKHTKKMKFYSTKVMSQNIFIF